MQWSAILCFVKGEKMTLITVLTIWRHHSTRSSCRARSETVAR